MLDIVEGNMMKLACLKMNIIIAVILAFLTLWFAPAVQAESAAVQFDHNKTGFVLRDVHTTLRCEQCHVDGIFKNTPKDCAGCHAVGTRVGATPKPVNHVSTAREKCASTIPKKADAV